MDRRQEILRHIAPGTRGIEVAPWHNPIVPPGGARAAVVLDVFDRPTLLARAEADPALGRAMIRNIGEVDLVGSACDIAELAAARFGAGERFDFVVSSHNFEHLPDPVRFLRGCEALLAPGGVVAMAVPDKRACFDFFRPHSGTGEMLAAYLEHRDRPGFAQIFNQAAYNAGLRNAGGVAGAFSIEDNPGDVTLLGDVAQAYATWRGLTEANDTAYHDTHCWTFTPSSLELILTELVLLGLVNLDIVAVTPPLGCEFYVHLRKRAEGAAMPGGLAGRREVLLQQTIDELAYCSPRAWALRSVHGRALYADTPPRRGLRARIRAAARALRGA